VKRIWRGGERTWRLSLVQCNSDYRAAEEKAVLLYREKHALDIQIHDPVPPILLVHLIEPTPPCRSRICKQNINMIRMLCYFSHQPFNISNFGAVGGNRVCGCARLFVGERIESGDGFGTGAGFARGDEDLGAASLEETRGELVIVSK